jgi:hypothetical protein
MSSTFAPWVSANAPAVAASSATQNAVESTRATPGRFYVASEAATRRKKSWRIDQTEKITAKMPSPTAIT